MSYAPERLAEFGKLAAATSIRHAARTFGVSRTPVRKALRQAGIKSRRPGTYTNRELQRINFTP